ncbi:unnamed protein product [Eruca vesicaria subsp. sativa]|uniref:Myb-like domain-containing protein n=1 Tax=Eruca vesicaria subsp. sativa TaxID=29727 RepID=A0ABC8JLZ7_ERUVS|nr:unnamed protein product [Eruca vesicaria subsp. sativa]
MANHSWSNGDMNHQNTPFSNSTTSPESSDTKQLSGIAMNWSSEEQAILEEGLVRYAATEPSLTRYAKIASELQHKTVRDVAMRCRWIHKKDSNKRRKEDHNGFGRASVDNKEIIDMAVDSNSAPHLREEDRIIMELLKQNELFLNQIYSNLTSSSRLTENITLFHKTRENINNLLKNLQENAPEAMKRMPWPEKLSVDHDELLDSMLPLSTSPKQQPWLENLSTDHDDDQLLGSIFLSSTSPKQP